MKLALALQADMGDTISTEGVVKYIADPKNITGSSNGKPYSFWSQFAVIEEGEDSIGVSLTFNSQAECLKNKGMRIKVKGVMASYEKDGNEVKKIDKAKITEAVSSQTSSDVAQGTTSSDKNASYALSYAKDLVVAGAIPLSALFDVASQAKNFLNGKIAESQSQMKAFLGGKTAEPQSQENPDYIEDGTGGDDDLPF